MMEHTHKRRRFEDGDHETTNTEMEEGEHTVAPNTGKDSIEGKSKAKKVYPYGNYPAVSYYNHRTGLSGGDQRIDLLKPYADELFRKLKILDIGCHDGRLLIEFALRFDVQYALGLDIDEFLIARAKLNLKTRLKEMKESEEKVASMRAIQSSSHQQAPDSPKRTRKKKQGKGKQSEITSAPIVSLPPTESLSEDFVKINEENHRDTLEAISAVLPNCDPEKELTKFPISMPLMYGSLLSRKKAKKEVLLEAIDEEDHSIFFLRENFLAEKFDDSSGIYDTILCLSVTKWIHFNWGDDGIRVLFSKIFRLLKPGGHFVLEPQSGPSYHKKKKVSQTALYNYQRIKLWPEQFPEELLSIGFLLKKTLVPSAELLPKGFQRPIYILQKPS